MNESESIERSERSHSLQPSPSYLVGHGVPHKIINDRRDGLAKARIIIPGGLDNHLAKFGRPGRPGDSPPVAFERLAK